MFKRLRAFMERRTTAYKHTSQAAIYPVRSQAGPTVTQYGAMTLAGYYAGIRVLSSAFAQMPWRVYRIDRNEASTGVSITRQHAIDHPVDRLLRVRPNYEMNPSTFKELMIHWVMSWGNAYAEIERDSNGIVRGLWPIEPWRVTVRRRYGDQGNRNEDLYYQVTNYNDTPLYFNPGDLLHFRNQGDDIEGWSIVRLAANALGLYSAEQESMSSTLRNSAKLSGVMTPPGGASIPADKLGALEESFRSKMQGSANHGQVWFASKGLNFQSMQIPNTDMQLLESRKFSVIEICRFLGVPPTKVYDLERSTFNNVEQMNIDFLVDTVGPWVCRFEEEANYKLITRPRLFESRMDTTSLTRADAKSRMDYYKGLHSMGAINSDEIRAGEDMNPIPDGSGKQYFIQTNMAPLDSFMGEQPDTQPAIGRNPEPDRLEAPEEETADA